MATINAINTLWRRMCVFVCVCGHRGITRNLPFLLTRLCVSAWKVGQRMTTSIFHCRYFGDGAGTDATLGHRNTHTHTRRGTLQRPVKTQIKSANVETWVDLFQLQLKSLCVFVWPFEIATPCNSAKHKIRPCFIDFFVILSYITS